jgi:SAM-dependent methyltransferase
MGRRPPSSRSFDGISGRVAARVMARLNRDMEEAAVAALGEDIEPDALSIGCGPGEGVAALVRRMPAGRVVGIDPSAAMVQVAARRNRQAIGVGRVVLVRSSADCVPEPDGTFHVATAVNSLQLWEPLDASIRELVRVLRPGGRFVALTHDWAVEQRGGADAWLEVVGGALSAHGLTVTATARDRFRSGTGLLLRAERGTTPGGPEGRR